MGAQDDIDGLVRPGQVLAGKYRIERVLGKGGMGVVVAAHHLQLDEKVAIKFLLPAAIGKAELLARFEREARAAVKIKSEHVARVVDVGVLETGAPYMVMEFLEGMDLAACIAAETRLTVARTSELVLQASEAIVEAHALGIVHRDLKPANLFLTRGPDGLEAVKVLDFGISKSSALSGSAGSDMTQTQSMLGSPFYMSPEQMQSARNVDMRTDIWALGCILYQCITGEVPFAAESLPELVLRIVQSAPTPVATYRHDVPAGFEQVLHRCLEKNRDRRFQHLGELASALAPFVSERARASVDHVWRVIRTSGLAAGELPALSALPSSAPQLAVAKLGTLALSNGGDTGPGLPPHHRPSHPGPPSGGTVGIGPPRNTLPPSASSSRASNAKFGATSNAGTWGNTTGHRVPMTGRFTAVMAVGGAIAIVLTIGMAGLFGAKRLLGKDDKADAGGLGLVASAPPGIAASTVIAEHEPDVAVAIDGGPPRPIPAPVPTVRPPAPTPVPVPIPIPAPVPAPTKPAGPNCNPPYTWEKGLKVFKKECV